MLLFVGGIRLIEATHFVAKMSEQSLY